jgi:DNA polymerase-3 subunit alpha
MECARIIAGYTLGGADMLRRAMGKKDAEAMEKERVTFVAGAKRVHAIEEWKANEIFDLLNKFASYGFNKSHSAAYAIIGYQTAFLKANYPVQFMAAVLSSEIGNSEKVSHFIDEAQVMGIEVLGPDVNESRESFTPVIKKVPGSEFRVSGPEGPVPGSGFRVPSSGDSKLETRNPEPGTIAGASGAIRFGLAGIKGVGEAASKKILEEREAAGPYRDFADFLLRVDLRAINKRVLECLVLTGAFEFSGAPREELYNQIDAALAALGELQRKYPALRKEPANGAAGAAPPADEGALLFDLATPAPTLPPRETLATEFAQIMRVSVMRKTAAAPDSVAPAQSSRDMLDLGMTVATAARPTVVAAKADARIVNGATTLQYEKELLGFYVSGHPMDAYAGLAEAIDTFPPEELQQQSSDRVEFRLCGIAGNIVKKYSKKDNRPWAPFTLSTRRAAIALNMFADAYEAYGKHLAENAPLLVQGNVILGNDGARINVKECYPLAAAVASLVKKITWLVRPAHPELPAFLRLLRTTVNQAPGDTRMEFAFVFDDRTAPVAEASSALTWKVAGKTFQALRRHPAVAGVLIEAKRLELRPDRRWGKRG